MQENPKPRRWYRFSLRTMLVLVTLVCILCGYLGWAMNWIQQRRAFLSKPGIQAFDAETYWPAPMPLSLLGERGLIAIGITTNEKDEREAYRLFPESDQIVPFYDDGRQPSPPAPTSPPRA